MHTLYMVYGRSKDGGRFRPLDMSKGRFVVNKVHATLYSIERAKQVAENLNKEDMNFIFQVRKA